MPILFSVFLLLAYVIELLLHLLFKDAPLVLFNAIHIFSVAFIGLGFLAWEVTGFIILIRERWKRKRKGDLDNEND